MKKIIVGSILVVGLATGFAYAHGGNNWGGSQMMGGGPHYGMMGPGMMGNGGYNTCPGANWSGQTPLTDEDYQKYMDQTAEMRKQMHDLRFKYMEAYRKPDTTQKNLMQIEQEMNDLRSKMFEISEQLRAGK